MAKMRETTKKQSKAAEYTLTPVEINGQTVMMKVYKPVASPRGVTARCQG